MVYKGAVEYTSQPVADFVCSGFLYTRRGFHYYSICFTKKSAELIAFFHEDVHAMRPCIAYIFYI
jgi:hypothetical protein